MQAPKSPHQEITSEDNERILGTLTARAWARWQVTAARKEFFEDHAGENVLRRALQSSGAIGGEHRRDLVEAIQGAKPAPMAITVPNVPSNEPRL